MGQGPYLEVQSGRQERLHQAKVISRIPSQSRPGDGKRVLSSFSECIDPWTSKQFSKPQRCSMSCLVLSLMWPLGSTWKLGPSQASEANSDPSRRNLRGCSLEPRDLACLLLIWQIKKVNPQENKHLGQSHTESCWPSWHLNLSLPVSEFACIWV